MSRIALEVCVDDQAGLSAACNGGTDRIELCSALSLGGLTPSAGLVSLAASCGLPVMAMIRPRAGGFCWSKDEHRAMLTEITAMRQAGLAGVVIGAALPDGQLDISALAEMVDAAGNMQITLHRVIDLCPDPVAAVSICRELGITRILSSGGAISAPDGLPCLVRMAEAGGDAVSVMPGGGVTASNAAVFAAQLPLRDIHASCSETAPAPADPRLIRFGFTPQSARRTCPAKVAELRAELDRL